MRYKSTRGGTATQDNYYSFEDALFSGYAPDGGLFVPASLPSIGREKEQYSLWANMTFPELVYDVLRKFIAPTEIDDTNLKSICDQSFPADAFDEECYIPIKDVGSSLHIAELFHGPTFCFKDFGMRPVINLLSYFATLRNQPITLLVSTTGDTGPAAVHAVNDASNPLLTILVHYPHGQISDFQRKQLTTLQSKYVKVASFEGGGDDMDWPIKETLLSSKKDNGRKESEGGRLFCGINSYNIGRPLFQMTLFIWIYLRMAEKMGLSPGDENSLIDMVLPTGAMGNLTGAYMAKQMGIPIGRLYCGVNINDITHRVIDRGEFHQQKIEKTLSEALNVEVPYNFERILFYLSGGNESMVKAWMETMDETRQLSLDKQWLKRLQQDFRSASITDDEMCDALRDTYESSPENYLCDPHTAVAVAAAKKLGCLCINESSSRRETQQADELTARQLRNVVIIATASPCKFEEAVTIALGKDSWAKWKSSFFPSRAQQTMELEEVKPFHYHWDHSRYATLKEVQSVWTDKMMHIVKNNFEE